MALLWCKNLALHGNYVCRQHYSINNRLISFSWHGLVQIQLHGSQSLSQSDEKIAGKFAILLLTKFGNLLFVCTCFLYTLYMYILQIS